MSRLLPLALLGFASLTGSIEAFAQQPAEPGFGPVKLSDAWKHSISDGNAQAKGLPSRQLLISLSSPTCGQCDRMDKLILPSQAFEEMFGDKALVRLDWGSDDAKAVAARFGIAAPPAWIWLTDDGLLVGLQAGPSNQPTWFRTMSEAGDRWKAYQGKIARERVNPGDRDLVLDVAIETFKRGGDELAAPRLKRIGEDPKAPAATRSTALAYLSSIEMDRRQLDEAERHLKLLLKLSDDASMKEKAELRLADVAVGLGRKDRALSLLKKFKKDHPDSIHVPEVDRLLEALRGHGTGAPPTSAPGKAS